MRLTEEDMKAGLLHPRRPVRNVVVKHFVESLTNDPDVTRQAIRGVEQFGWSRFLTWEHMFSRLPLNDEASFVWVCDQMERTDDEAPSQRQKGHLARMLAGGEITLIQRHSSRLLEAQGLPLKEKASLRMRLDIAQLEPDECWRRLEAHCERAKETTSFAEAKIHEAELLLEPIVRAGNRFAPNVLEILRRPLPPPEGGGADAWLIAMAIIVAGRLRLEEAAPLLWKFLDLDWDWHSELISDALVRIGTPSVVQLARERYPDAEWSVRNFANNLFENIRCEEAVAAIPAMLEAEDDDEFRGQLGAAAAMQFDERLVPWALKVFHEDPDDPTRGLIREALVAFSYFSGWELPERDEWERVIDEEDDFITRYFDPVTSPVGKLMSRLATDNEFPIEAFDDLDDLDEDDHEDAEEIAAADTHLFLGAPIRGAVHAGRNDPCPCGSGKKYKKCCLRGGSE